MKLLYGAVVFLILAALVALPGFGVEPVTERGELVRTVMTVGGALVGLGIMGPTAFYLVPEEVPLSDRLLVTLPAAGVAAGLGAVVGRWVADAALSSHPSLVASLFLGAGLGATAGAVVGSVSFALALAIAVPTVDAPPGYWGRDFTYLQTVGMGFLAGAFWGGIAGLPVGAVTVPIISIYMDF